ncbi:hypothetical protein DM02DRAFT_51408 [Periconia macrospinosa]|uniref:Uncharacterized protein n=1 Tax=Periconia macrospinosa TaxID=97972 RepID=A0A2V1DK93_9PLEO|nr:hypothetical protein DM02DRAFT_51408 [Periconia macrospinosa]
MRTFIQVDSSNFRLYSIRRLFWPLLSYFLCFLLKFIYLLQFQFSSVHCMKIADSLPEMQVSHNPPTASYKITLILSNPRK